MTLPVVDLSNESLSGIGRMLTPTEWISPEKGQDYSYADIVGDIGLPSSCSAGALESVSRPMILARMERHLRTPEALVALEGEAVLCVAPPQEGANGSLSGISALRIRAGQAIVLETGAWHWIPFPLDGGSARFLVIFRGGTGRDDLQYHDLRQAISVKP